jgi:hypothetical protein
VAIITLCPCVAACATGSPVEMSCARGSFTVRGVARITACLFTTRDALPRQLNFGLVERAPGRRKDIIVAGRREKRTSAISMRR